MIKKYALDPEALHDTESLTHFVRNLGVHKGRVLAHYPKKWLQRANAQLRKTTADSIEDLRIREAILKIESEGALSFIPDNPPPYDGTKPWVENAVENFHLFTFGLYADNNEPDVPHPSLHPFSQLKGVWDPAYWDVEGYVDLHDNSASSVVQHLTSFLELEDTAVFMDPYSAPNDDFSKFILEVLRQVPSLQNIILHSGKNDLDSENWGSSWMTCLKGKIPDKTILTIVRWRTRGNERPHKRWVINHKGGIVADRGFPHQKFTSTLTLMPIREALGYWNEFARGPWSDGTYYFRDAFQFDATDYTRIDHPEERRTPELNVHRATSLNL